MACRAQKAAVPRLGKRTKHIKADVKICARHISVVRVEATANEDRFLSLFAEPERHQNGFGACSCAIIHRSVRL